MKLFTLKRIRTRFTTWFILLTIVPLFGVLTITYFRQTTVIENQSSDKLIAIRNLKVNQLKNWLSERSGDMRTISTDKELTDLEYVIHKTSFNQNDKIILKNSRQILNRYLNNFPTYEELFIVNPENGKVILSSDKQREGMDKVNNEFFAKALQSRSLIFKNIYTSNTLSKNSMSYSIPIFSSQHAGEHITGILVARINLEKTLYKILLERVGLGETGETLIVNEDVIALNELRWHDDAPLKLKISSEPAINAAAGKTGIAVTIDYRKQNVLAAYTYIPETKWGFICKQDIAELHAPIRKMLLDFIVLYLVTIIIVFFMSYVISKSISKPIINLNHIAKKIKAGNLSARSTYTSTDEVGELSLVFNSMADAIESRIKTQKEVSAISETMIKQTSLHEFSTSLLKHMMKISGANISVFYILNEATAAYEHFVSFGTNKELLKTVNVDKADSEFKNTLDNKSIYFLTTISEDTILKYKTIANDAIPKEIITIPVVVDSLIIALISLVNINKFDSESFEVLKQSWQSVNVSYSNLLSNERTRILAESLVRTNEQLEEQSGKLKKQSEKLLQNTNELQSANDELEAFAYSVSHDLRAPLRHIDGFTKLLEKRIKDKIDKQSHNYFDNIISSSKRMNQLINDLLVFSRTSTKDIRKTKVKMKKIVDEAMLPYTINMEYNNIAFIIDEMPNVKVDISLFRQVWENLISNAIKFTINSKNPEIHIGADKDIKGKIVFFISDNGVGFNQKYVDKVFGVFQRLHSVDEFPGTGIGLANVKRIIMKHGGTIWAEGKVNKGATFFITLP